MKLLCRIGRHDWAGWQALNKTAIADDANWQGRKCLECGWIQKKLIGGLLAQRQLNKSSKQ